MSLVANVPLFTTNSGVKIPCVGLGCWINHPRSGERVYAMVKKALEVGYRRIDTASGYSNEEGVSRAIRESGVTRSEIFVTTTLSYSEHVDVQGAFNQSLAALRTEYVDLYIMHWPQAAWGSGVQVEPATLPTTNPAFVEKWLVMEKLLKSGKVRLIGVSNFGPSLLRLLLSDPRVSVLPTCNQVELRSSLPARALQELCADKGIVLMGYTPAGQSKAGAPWPFPLLTHPAVLAIAEEYNALPTQVLLSWAIVRERTVSRKCEREDELRVNIIVCLLSLTAEQISIIDALQTKTSSHQSSLRHHSDNTCEPDMVKRGI